MSIPEEFLSDSLKLLEELLRIPAFSGDEKAKTDLLEKRLQDWNYQPKRFGNNLCLMDDFIPGKPVVWLHSHIDTVRPTQDWTSDPFSGSFLNRKLVALGSNDAGASVVAQLAAYRFLQQNGPKINWIWIAGAEEENSGPNGITSLLEHLPAADLVVVGEPTSNKAAVAEKGLMVVDVEVKGKAGHAAREEGMNALYLALGDLAWFRDFRFPRVSEFLGPVKMNVTICSAGDRHNTIPDLCKFTADIRLNELYTHEQILQIISASIRGTARARSMRLKPSATPKNHAVWKAIQSMKLETYGSPTLSDQALIPYPSIKMGPGDSARSHTADEYIYAQEIKEGAEQYAQLLLKTYGNE